MSGPFYFAWLDGYAAFDAETHAVEDEDIYSIELTQNEGEFASLSVEIDNPRAGLLTAGRQQYCWLSWDSGDGIIPLFTGRLVAAPEDFYAEIIKVTFVARPDDYADRKASLAETLKVAPFWDPVWLAQQQDDPDTVLEARTQLWHIDRASLDVTVSDIISGEDGTIEIDEDTHFYDGMSVTYAGTPKRRVIGKGTVTWTQQGSGEIDLTRQLVEAFQAAGSPVIYPLVSSLTGDGLQSDWPQAGQNIGEGWSVGGDASIDQAVWVEKVGKAVVYLKENDASGVDPETTTSPLLGSLSPFLNSPSARLLAGYTRYSVQFYLGIFAVYFPVQWQASRPRSETVTFTLAADIQSLLVDPDADEDITIDLSSDLVGQPIDADAALPIGSLLRNSYLLTDRGQQSFQYLLSLGRAQLIAAARAVLIKLQMPWLAATVAVTLRRNIRLLDRRLPGGEATGKIIGYSLNVTGDTGEAYVEATLGCTIGHGGSVSATAGDDDYADDYVEDGYLQTVGTTIDPGTEDLTYQSFDEISVIDDDGLNLLNLLADDVVTGLSVTNGVGAQLAAVTGTSPPDDPVTVLGQLPTQVNLSLKAVTGRSFHTDFAPDVSTLVVPKTIDLEAAAA